MDDMRKVFNFEFLNIIRRKSFFLSVILIPLIPTVILFVLGKLNTEQSKSLTEVFTAEAANPLPIGVVDQSGLITAYPKWLTEGALIEVADEATARQKIANNQLEGFYLIEPNYLETGKVTYLKPEINMVTEIVQQGVLDDLITYNLMNQDQALYLRYTNPVSFNYSFINEETADTRDQENFLTMGVPYSITMLFYTIIIVGSSFMLNAIGKDKENKTIEVLLTSAKPFQIFLGKLLAYGAASLTQMFAWVGAFLVIAKLGGASISFLQGIDLPANIILWAIPFFVLGYLIYGSLMAGIGAMAPNIREGNQSSFILMLPLIFVLINISQLITEPRRPMSVVLSLFPLTSPVAMMTRLSIGQVPFWQVSLALLLLLGFTFLVIRAVANLFSSQILLSGEKFNLKSFFRTLFLAR